MYSMVPDNQEPQEAWRHQSQLPEDPEHIALSFSPITGLEDPTHQTHPSDDRPLPQDLLTLKIYTFPEHIHLPSPQDDGVTFKDDDEPDEILLQPTPNEKDVKIEGVVKLKQDRGFSNYRNWQIELNNVFDADPAWYNTAIKQVAFAMKYFDSKMRIAWRVQA
jgi:hypothetical protein